MPMESNSTPSPTQKTKIDQVIDRLFAYLQRQWRLVALVILYTFFRPTFESKLVALLQSFEPSWGSLIVWLAIIVTALTYTYVLCRRRYVISEGVRFWTAVLLVGWAYYRFIDTHYIAIPPPITGVCYVDLLPILGSCVALVVGWSHWKRAKPKQEGVHNSRLGYEVECPCTAEDEDLLGRIKEAQDLAEKIFQTDTSNAAFTLGLTAPWGAGKTSFMLAMKDYLEKQHSDETILLDFNPWMYRKAPNLTQIFFEEFSRALAPYNSALASGFTRYVDHILAKDDSAWLQFGARLLPQGFKEKSTSEQYDFLKKEIGRLGRKIVIFIDDVDRLDSEELIELFSLIRNSSLSFPYMSYILAYDKEYVASQLQGKFNEHTYRYMEKILQVEYPLAKITPEQLEEALRLELKRIGSDDLCTPIESSEVQLVYHLPTLRAIKRICNTLSSYRKELEGNVALFDWFIIELIRIQYPRVFDLLRVNYTRILRSEGDQYIINVLEKGEEQNPLATASLPDHPLYGGIIHPSRYLSEHQDSLQIKNVGLVIELMEMVWGESRKVAPLQANHVDYIGRYFYRALSNVEIDDIAFHRHMDCPYQELKPYVQQKHTTHQWEDLCTRVYEKAECLEDIVKVLRLTFYMHSISEDMVMVRTINDLIDRLRDSSEGRELKDTLKNILECADIRVGVLRYFGYAGEYGHSSTLPFNQDEIEEIKERLFLLYIEEADPLDPVECYCLWLQNRIAIKIAPKGETLLKHSHVICHPKMDKIMKEIIEKNIELLIPCFIEQDSLSKDEYYLQLPYPIWYTNKKKNGSEIGYFSDFIFGLDGDSSPIIKEFQALIREWLKMESNKIPFEFKHITPANIQWRRRYRFLYF